MDSLKKQFSAKIKKFGKWPALVLLAILVLGIFLRAYKFEPWLHFELDQARDAALVQEAMDGGVGKLPLLGPRAAGTFLRLGPVFYYVEYFFAKIFNDSIVGSAKSILFFAILSIPAAFFFFRRYFSKKNSLLILGVFSVSLYLVTYAKFSWNPNMLPFFVLMFLLALLLTVDEKKSDKERGLWLAGAAFFFGFLSQLHFLALIILSLAGVAFLLHKRPRILLRYWALATLAFLFLYIPVFVNEYKTEGLNAKLFLSAVTKKSEKNPRSLPEKAVRNFSENADYYWVIVSGSQTARIPSVDMRGGIDFKCDKICRENLGQGFLAVLFFSVGAGLLFWRATRLKKGAKKDFLVLNSFLFVSSFLVFLPLAYSFSARFFLIALPLPFVFLGLMLEKLDSLEKWKFSQKKYLALILVSAMVLSNLFFVNVYFRQLNDAKDKYFDLSQDKILKQKTRITLEQELLIIDYLESFYRQNNQPIIYIAQSEFHRSLAFLLDNRQIPRNGIKMNEICRNGNFFLVLRSQSDFDRSAAKYEERFDIFGEKAFGTLTVFELAPKDEFLTCEEFDQSKFRNYKNEGGAAAKRYNWEEVFEDFQK